MTAAGSEPSRIRQDSLTDQMSTVMQLAVEAGCYDAHDWIVARWGRRDGICGAATKGLALAGEHERPRYCHLTAGHRGAHSDCNGQHPMHWMETTS